MPFTLKSPAFSPGGQIPQQYTGEGQNISPPLEWEGLPDGTAELVLICDDPDAPSVEPFVHWVLYKIPIRITGLPAGIPPDETLEPFGMVQGVNSTGKIGYTGPLPPPGHGWHRYHFKLYALDHELILGPGASKESVLQACNGSILAETRFTGMYLREKKVA